MPSPFERRIAARTLLYHASTVLLSLVLAILASGQTPVHAKTPGQTYCFRGVCHRVLTLEETKRAVGRSETVLASFYDDPRRDGGNPNIHTSSGERFDGTSDRTAASPIYPNGTRLLIWNPRTRAAAEVRVTNSGPYHGARRLDVSRGAAERLGFRPLGVSQLSVIVLAPPTPLEAQYIRGRRYTPAAGYLGLFASPLQALAAVAVRPQPTAVATAAPNASAQLTTASVGWDTSVRPVRPPLERVPATSMPASAAARTSNPVAPAPSPAAPQLPSAASRGTANSGWTSTLTLSPSPGGLSIRP